MHHAEHNSAFFEPIKEEVLPPDNESLEKSKVLLIRHATTEFNVEHQKVLKDFAKNEIKIIAKFKRSVAEIFYFIFAKFKTFL